MPEKQKMITLEDCRSKTAVSGEEFRVSKLQNSVSYIIGQMISNSDAANLCKHDSIWKVIVVEPKD